MYDLTRPLALLMLFTYVLIPLVSSKDLCEEYTADYKCKNESISVISRSLLEEPTCGSDLVETTIRLMNEGDVVIEKLFAQMNNKEEAVLLIGNTKAGKSTLAYFVAGNDSRMIAYNDGPDYLIKDCNGKIGGSSIISETMFPNLIIQQGTNIAFFDYPGFVDTRAECVEIANAYFMLKVAHNVPKVKVVVVMNNPYNTRSGGDFPSMLKSVINFIPSISKLGSSISIIATKTPGYPATDEERVKYIMQYLTNILPDLKDTGMFDSEELKKAEFLVRTLTDKSKIAVFRSPNECGPLSKIEFMQQNKKNILHVIVDNLKYTQMEKSDFATSLSAGAKGALTKLKDILSFAIPSSLESIRKVVNDFVFLNNNCIDHAKCSVLVSRLDILYKNEDFSNGYNKNSFLGLGYDKITARLLASIALPNTNISNNITDSIQKSARYVDFLKSQDSNLVVDIVPWLKPFQDLKTDFAKNVAGVVKDDIYNSIRTYLKNLAPTLFTIVVRGFDSTKDIFERNTKIAKYLTQITILHTNMKEEVEKHVLLATYLKSTVDAFLKLGTPTADNSAKMLLEKIRFVSFLETAEVDTKIKDAEQDLFLEPFTSLKDLVSKEGDWCTFLINLYDNLSKDIVQLEDRFELKPWWKFNGNIEFTGSDDSKLIAFWTHFKEIDAIKNKKIESIKEILQQGRSTKLSSLNLLLSTTLTDSLTCGMTSGYCVCEGNYISVKKAVENKNCDIKKTSSLVIYGYHTIFVNFDLVGTTFNNGNNVNILTVFPKWWGAGGSFNLTGKSGSNQNPVGGTGNTPGAAGYVGGIAGNFYGIGKDFTEFNAYSSSVTVDGGRGGDGQNGQLGYRGTDGVHVPVSWPKTTLPKSDCIAWRGNSIEIKYPRPNSCGDGHCSEGSHQIYSQGGSDGGPGGDGGKSGLGGSPGNYTFPIQSKNASGSSGAKGNKGSGGNGGQGGSKVKYTQVEVDSYYDAGDAEYRCRCQSKSEIETTERFNPGESGMAGVAGQQENPKEQTFKPDDFKTYITQFKTKAASKAVSNDFLKLLLNNFIASINGESTIPK